jgi:hypothetical protein
MLHEPNSEAIRKELEPGHAVHAERRTGKTTALLAEIHTQLRGRAIIIAHHQESAERISYIYREAFPQDEIPLVAGPVRAMVTLLGTNLPVYVDEWWLLPEKAQKELKDSGRIKGAVGTVPHLAKIRL